MATLKHIETGLGEIKETLGRFVNCVPKSLPRTHETPEGASLQVASWTNGSLEAILRVSDSIYHLDEKAFWGFLPTVLETVVRFRDDPRIGNLFHIVQYTLEDGYGRSSILEHLDHNEWVIVSRVLNDIHEFVFDRPVK